jgi:hypothetical protein
MSPVESRIRSTKFVVWSHVSPKQEFRVILVSRDLAAQLNLNLYDNPVFESIPIKCDDKLPENSVVFIPAG